MLSYESLARDVSGCPADDAVFLCGLECAAEVSLVRHRIGRAATSPLDILTELLLEVPGETTESVTLFPAHLEKTHALAPGVTARSRWFAAHDAPCLAVSWTVENRSSAAYCFELRGTGEYNVNYISKFRRIPNDTARLAGRWLLVADTRYPELCAATATEPAWEVCTIGPDADEPHVTGEATGLAQVRAAWTLRAVVPAGATRTVTLALAGCVGEERARAAAEQLLAEPEAVLERTIAAWRRRIAAGATVHSPHPELDAFFLQSKLWGYRDARNVPLGAPFDITSNTNSMLAALTASPDYHGLFANDNAQSCWEYGALGPDFYPILANTLEVLYRFGTPESVEIDPFGATGQPWCSPLRIGERPQWVIGACALVLWSGRYLDLCWPRIQSVLARFGEDDQDGDWLDDYSSSTFPEQPDPGRFRHEMLYASAFWYQAFREASKVASYAGEPQRAAEYRAAAENIAGAIEARFGAAHGYASWLDETHAQHPHRGHTAVLPLQYGIASAQRAARTFETLLSPPLWSDDGPLAVEPAYPLDGGAHAWAFMRWNLVHALFRYGHADRAAELMLGWARQERELHYQAPEGFPTITGVTGKGYSWTAGRALRAVLFGLFGLELLPDGFSVRPALPSGWPALNLVGLPFRGATYDIHVARGSRRLLLLDGHEVAGDHIPAPAGPGHHHIAVIVPPLAP